MSDTRAHIAQQRDLLATIGKFKRQRKKKFLHSADIIAVILRNAGHGPRQLGLYRWYWDVSSSCERSKVVQMSGRPFADVQDNHQAIGLDLEVRCRRCESCRRARSAMWRLRSAQETATSNRTWMGTLTLSPESQQTTLERVRAKEAMSGIDFDVLPLREQFELLVSEIGRDLTKYLKRIRFESGAALRYLLVSERHKSGLPHFHALVHEPVMHSRIGERVLREQWQLGFSRWKLADTKSPGYVCKYIAKDAHTRIRASLHYGESTPLGDTLSLEIANHLACIQTPENTSYLSGLTNGAGLNG